MPKRSISVSEASSESVGSCNACTTYTGWGGVARHDVTVIELRSISIRVCDDCRKVLMKELLRLAEPAAKAGARRED